MRAHDNAPRHAYGGTVGSACGNAVVIRWLSGGVELYLSLQNYSCSLHKQSPVSNVKFLNSMGKSLWEAKL